MGSIEMIHPAPKGAAFLLALHNRPHGLRIDERTPRHGTGRGRIFMIGLQPRKEGCIAG
jgi:hypothetical protein